MWDASTGPFAAPPIAGRPNDTRRILDTGWAGSPPQFRLRFQALGGHSYTVQLRGAFEHLSAVLAVDAGRLPLLDRRIRDFLQPFDIVKIKVYSADAKIVYSTDRSIIGRVDAENRRLQRALAGQVDSRLEKKEEVLDLTDERKIDVDVVETYIPIRDEKGRVVEVFASEDGKSWTIVATMATGVACMLSSGDGWEAVERKPLGNVLSSSFRTKLLPRPSSGVIAQVMWYRPY